MLLVKPSTATLLKVASLSLNLRHIQSPIQATATRHCIDLSLDEFSPPTHLRMRRNIPIRIRNLMLLQNLLERQSPEIASGMNHGSLLHQKHTITLTGDALRSHTIIE